MIIDYLEILKEKKTPEEINAMSPEEFQSYEEAHSLAKRMKDKAEAEKFDKKANEVADKVLNEKTLKQKITEMSPEQHKQYIKGLEVA